MANDENKIPRPGPNTMDESPNFSYSLPNMGPNFSGALIDMGRSADFFPSNVGIESYFPGQESSGNSLDSMGTLREALDSAIAGGVENLNAISLPSQIEAYDWYSKGYDQLPKVPLTQGEVNEMGIKAIEIQQRNLSNQELTYNQRAQKVQQEIAELLMEKGVPVSQAEIDPFDVSGDSFGSFIDRIEVVPDAEDAGGGSEAAPTSTDEVTIDEDESNSGTSNPGDLTNDNDLGGDVPDLDTEHPFLYKGDGVLENVFTGQIVVVGPEEAANLEVGGRYSGGTEPKGPNQVGTPEETINITLNPGMGGNNRAPTDGTGGNNVPTDTNTNTDTGNSPGGQTGTAPGGNSGNGNLGNGNPVVIPPRNTNGGTGTEGKGDEGTGSGTGPGTGPGDQPDKSLTQILAAQPRVPITTELYRREINRINRNEPSLLNRLFGVEYDDLS